MSVSCSTGVTTAPYVAMLPTTVLQSSDAGFLVAVFRS